MKTTFNQPVTELIKLRHSVRNYKEEALPSEVISQIEEYITTVDNPFHKKINIKLIEKSSQNKDVKLGTYGVIKGVKYFLVTSCENDAESFMALGYSLEKVILYCTSLGLGTVWLGGTFNKSGFAKAMGLVEKEVVPIVAPVGYEGGKKSLIGKLMGDHSKKRKAFSEIFFEGSFSTTLLPEKDGSYKKPLEMLRLAPSAVNKQPWRAVKVGEMIHFYLASTIDMNRIDIGIGLCHFDLTAKEMGLDGIFLVEEDVIKNDRYTYVISWKETK